MKISGLVLLLSFCLLLSGCLERTASDGSFPAEERPPSTQAASAEPLAEPAASPEPESMPNESEPEFSELEEASPIEQEPIEENPVQASEIASPEIASEEAVISAFAVTELDDLTIQMVTGVSWQTDCPVALEDLRLVTVTYIDFSGSAATGVLMVHHTLAQEVTDIFRELYEARFPIAGIALIDDYEGDDNTSMEANNTSCFCTRLIAGTDRYSRHSYGMAIDINPVQNPYVTAAAVRPSSAADYIDRANIRPGMIIPGDVCHTAFASRGWVWGGNWANPDYQHFEKVS